MVVPFQDEPPCHPSCCHACEICSNLGCYYDDWQKWVEKITYPLMGDASTEYMPIDIE